MYVQNCFGYWYGTQSACVCGSVLDSFFWCVCVCVVCPLHVMLIGSKVSVWLVPFCMILYGLTGLSLHVIPLFV